MDLLIPEINSRPEFGMTVKYGTMSEYLNALKNVGDALPTYTGDFFPYHRAWHTYWYFVVLVTDN